MLIESHDPDFVTNNLLLIVMGKLLTPKAAILLRDEKSGEMYVASSKGRTGLAPDVRFHCPPENCPVDKPVYEIDEICDIMPEAVRESGLKLFFTIRTSTEHLGYLCIAPKIGKGHYPAEELNFIENLVIISAVALSNSMLVSRLKSANRELDQKVQELNTLFDISREFNAMVDRSQMLNVFRFTLMGQMFVRRFFFLMRMEGKPQIVIQHGLKGQVSNEAKEQILNMDAEYLEVSAMDNPPEFLVQNEIIALVRVSFQDERAVLGISKRANNESYTRSDYNFLISLGNLAFLSIQKTFLLESRIEKERMEEELTIARTIQNMLFPSPIPKPKPFDIAAINVPSRQVGGDYYDVLCADEKQLYLAIADVTGKGIPASLLMANLQAMLHVLSPLDLDLAATTGKINNIIYKNTPIDKFISFFWGRIDLESMVFEYCNAGHNPPVLWNAEKSSIEHLSTGGMLLGALETMMPYESGTVHLNRGDVVIMFTDGISEAMNEQDEEFGEERIAELLEEHHQKTAGEIQRIILDEVKAFCKGNYGDDITMLLFKVD
ncbi:MAG: PP2C family protein-serine/threonine phosphatase [Balneolia bacterium]|nr:PP2C family protein-serine/threonine phosphatase [Balneolia bacterium]